MFHTYHHIDVGYWLFSLKYAPHIPPHKIGCWLFSLKYALQIPPHRCRLLVVYSEVCSTHTTILFLSFAIRFLNLCDPIHFLSVCYPVPIRFLNLSKLCNLTLNFSRPHVSDVTSWYGLAFCKTLDLTLNLSRPCGLTLNLKWRNPSLLTSATFRDTKTLLRQA